MGWEVPLGGMRERGVRVLEGDWTAGLWDAVCVGWLLWGFGDSKGCEYFGFRCSRILLRWLGWAWFGRYDGSMENGYPAQGM